MRDDGLVDGFLPHLDRGRIIACFRASPGNEIESGKFSSKESSAALAANTFGLFLDRPDDFPPMPGLEAARPIIRVDIERTLRFPWSGGRHPWLDAVVETNVELIGVESKRYEPFRTKKQAAFSTAYSRSVWGSSMGRYEALRDALRSGSFTTLHLDATQLVKHAFGLVSQARALRKQPILVYLYAEPPGWPDGTTIPAAAIAAHRADIDTFARMVDGDEVRFVPLSYARLLAAFAASPDADVRRHGEAVRIAFQPF